MEEDRAEKSATCQQFIFTQQLTPRVLSSGHIPSDDDKEDKDNDKIDNANNNEDKVNKDYDNNKEDNKDKVSRSTIIPLLQKALWSFSKIFDVWTRINILKSKTAQMFIF